MKIIINLFFILCATLESRSQNSIDLGFRVTPIYLKSPLGIFPVYINKYLNADKHLTGFYFSTTKVIFKSKNKNVYASSRIRYDVSETTFDRNANIDIEGKSKFFYEIELGSLIKIKKPKNLYYGYSIAINNLNSGYTFKRNIDSTEGKSNFIFFSPSLFCRKRV